VTSAFVGGLALRHPCRWALALGLVCDCDGMGDTRVAADFVLQTYHRGPCCASSAWETNENMNHAGLASFLLVASALSEIKGQPRQHQHQHQHPAAL